MEATTKLQKAGRMFLLGLIARHGLAGAARVLRAMGYDVDVLREDKEGDVVLVALWTEDGPNAACDRCAVQPLAAALKDAPEWQILRGFRPANATSRLEPSCGHRLNAFPGAAELSQVAIYIHIGTIQRAAPLPAGVRIDADFLKGEEHIAIARSRLACLSGASCALRAIA